MIKQAKYTSLRQGEKIRIVFLFQVASYWPSWESVYNACLGDSRFDVKLVWLNETTLRDFHNRAAETFLHNNIFSYETFNWSNIVSFAPHIVAVQSPVDTLLRPSRALSLRFKQIGARILYIPYGIEISDDVDSRIYHFLSLTILNAWRIYTLSNKMAQDYHNYCPNRGAVRVAGHPKFDAYIDRDRFAAPKPLNESCDRQKTVLWKVHMPKVLRVAGEPTLITPVLEEYIRFAEYIAISSHLSFVFRPHPEMLGKGTPLPYREQVAKLMEILQKAANVHVDSTDDYRNALLNADAIIIDRSALMVEAAIAGVPILYMYNIDNPEKLTDAIAPLVQSYYQGTSAEDMIAFLEMFQAGQDPKKAMRESALAECVPYRDGKCSQRIVDDMANSIISEKQDVPLRIAVFALGEVFHHYWGKTNIFKRDDIEIVVFSDNNQYLWGSELEGIPIVEPLRLRDYALDAIVIFSEFYFYEIYKQLVFEIVIDMDKIWRLDKFLIALESNYGDYQ